MKAWHFMRDDNGAPILRDGTRPPPIGEWLEHDGALRLCRSGLHASTRAIDALHYAPGPWAARVECAGEVEHDDDKLVCSRRRIIAMADATDTLRAFGRACALDVIHLWDAPAVVREYLETGDESLRASAREAAAREAAWAARAAAWAAAREAAWAARAAAEKARAAAEKARDAAWAPAADKQNARLERMLRELLGGE